MSLTIDPWRVVGWTVEIAVILIVLIALRVLVNVNRQLKQVQADSERAARLALEDLRAKMAGARK